MESAYLHTATATNPGEAYDLNESQQADLLTLDNHTAPFIGVVTGNRENYEPIREFIAVLCLDSSDVWLS